MRGAGSGLVAVVTVAALAAVAPLAGRAEAAPALERIASFAGPPPTAVAVSRGGRVFVAVPGRGLIEVRPDGQAPFPRRAGRRRVRVQGATIDGQDRLWTVDRGAGREGAPVTALLALDLARDRVRHRITLGAAIAGPARALAHVRVDPRRGAEGVAYLADVAERAAVVVIVVDLATGRARRRRIEVPGAPRLQVTGLALSPDAALLHVGVTLAGEGHLLAVPTAGLVDPTRTDADLAVMVQDLGAAGVAAAVDADAAGRVYGATPGPPAALERRLPGGPTEVLVVDPVLRGARALALADDGFLYVLAGAPRGPTGIYRVRVDAGRARDEPPVREAPIDPAIR